MNVVGRLPEVPRIMEAGELAPWVAEFATELGSNRHTDLTIGGYMRLLPALGQDPRSYDAATIRRAILPQAQQCSPVYKKTMTTALRGYLRFLAAADLCAPGLEHAVPVSDIR